MTTTCLARGPMQTFLRGKTLRAEMVFEDPDPADPDDPYVDPDTVTVRIKHPGSSPEIEEFTYGVGSEIVKTDVGRYYILILLEEVGIWAVRWEGVGTWPAVDELQFRVRASALD